MISASAFPKEKPASVSSWVNLNGRIILRNAAGRNGAPSLRLRVVFQIQTR
jgi:hypothetical protein